MLLFLIILVLGSDSVLSTVESSSQLVKISNQAKDESTTVSLSNGGLSRGKRQFSMVAPVIPDEVKAQFKDYAKSYLNTMVSKMTQQDDSMKREHLPTQTRARICAEVCQHRCLPSCEWSCCIKENIEEYRSAHLVKPFASRHTVASNKKAVRKSQLSSHVSTNEHGEDHTDNGFHGKKRAHFVNLRQHNHNDETAETLQDGTECNLNCKHTCLPSCRFACCQPVQVKGMLVF